MVNLNTHITFLNHASYFIENQELILLIDPWVEQKAFDNGWSLLDQSTSNNEVISYLISQNKKVYIWYSHEHSDHFSLSFIKDLKKAELNANFIYQDTLDKRVINYLRGQLLNVIEVKDGYNYQLDKNTSIVTWKYKDGDSFNLIIINETKYILNLNDCNIDTAESASKIKQKIFKYCNKIDLLFVQFGYASWCGNENDVEYRIKIADEKLKKIKILNDIIKPEFIIPFATFSYFSDKENFYLNNEQNTPKKIRISKELSSIQEKIFFLKPWDKMNLVDIYAKSSKLTHLTRIAENYWNDLYISRKPNIEFITPTKLSDIENQWHKYKSKIIKNFIFFPLILEKLKIIRPLSIYLYDLKINIKLSYVHELCYQNSSTPEITINSNTLFFILKNDYGFNTTHVNGKFRTNKINSEKYFFKFFWFQELIKNGYGIDHPYKTIIKLIKLTIKKFINR